MINPHETEVFDFLYNFVHKHAEGVYYLTFQDGVQISAEYDTDYETDNGIDIDFDREGKCDGAGRGEIMWRI